MPIQDPRFLSQQPRKREEGGPVAYKPVPFDEAPPTEPARKPPVLQQVKRTDFPDQGNKGNKQFKDAAAAAQKQYEAENTGYLAETSQYQQAKKDWLARKATWDAKEDAKAKASGAGQERLQDFLKKPEGRQAVEFGNQMATYPFLPAGVVATQFGKGMRGPVSKLGYGLLEAGAGEGLREIVKQNQPNIYDDPEGYYRNQAYQNFLISSGLGAATGSARAALMKPKPPGPSLLDRLLPGRTAAAPATPPQASTPPAPPPVEPYKGTTRDVARLVAHDLGVGGDIAGDESKAAIVQRSLDAIRNGVSTPEQIATVAKKAHGSDPEKFLLERIGGSNRRLTGLAALLGLGAAAGVAGGPGEAEAAVPRETPKPKSKSEPSSYSSDLSDEYGTGLPKGAAREAIKGAAGTALAAAPVLGEARMAAELPHLYKPTPQDIEDSEYWQRGREEMAQPHASGGPAFNPQHLPEHERAHIENPQAAHDKAAWMLPYLRAGAEAQKRGEDFFGGSDQYERELAALKHFYHGRQQAPVAPESDTAPEAPTFAKGGAVSKRTKQISSIYDTFQAKLQDKDRMVSSLEKALERKPNPKLAKRLSKEKAEVERIREHLERVKAHAHAA